MARQTYIDDVFDVTCLAGLTADSRLVQPGYLFAAFAGSQVDGTQYISSAVARGACAILVQTGAVLPDDLSADVTVIYDDQPRRRFSAMVAEFYGYKQPEHVAAITGTNGKTSIAWFVRQIWQGLGYKSAALGTLGVVADAQYDVRTQNTSVTTPDPVWLHEELTRLSDAGVSHLAMEASSHGLDQYRMDGVRVRTAAFTNLSHDHLDYHPDMHSYLQAKLRLFVDVLLPDGVAVLNADVAEFDAIKAVLTDQQVVSYGIGGQDIQLISRVPTPMGQDLDLRVFGQSYKVQIPLIGEFQAMNVLCAVGIILAHDQSRCDDVMDIVSRLTCVPGRLELVEGHPRGAAVYVDYAHTPDALRCALEAVRPHVAGKLVCVFGCGGDRDRKKRPVMGQIASDLADVVYVTDDNPRGEDPVMIRAEIMKSAPSAFEVGDRGNAIAQAIKVLDEGDCLLIAGKGHEQGQTIGDQVLPFDDRICAQEAIQSLIQNSGGQNV